MVDSLDYDFAKFDGGRSLVAGSVSEPDWIEAVRSHPAPYFFIASWSRGACASSRVATSAGGPRHRRPDEVFGAAEVVGVLPDPGAFDLVEGLGADRLLQSEEDQSN